MWRQKCKKYVNIRNNTFFSFFNKIAISIIIKIIEEFIVENKNCTEFQNP